MIQPRNRTKYESLVAACAAGQTVTSWCEATATPRSTAATWQKLPQFAGDVAVLRKEMLDGAIGALTAAVGMAAGTMVELARSATDERVRLQAAQAILRNLIAATEFAELREKFDQLEARVAELDARGGTGRRPA